jgi:hypothetical protein
MSTPNFVGKYDLGDTVQLRATVLGTTLDVAAPSAFVFLVKNPLGSVATSVWNAAGASVISPGAGAFFKDIIIPMDQAYAGTWFYAAVATGLISSAEEYTFLVGRSNIL